MVGVIDSGSGGVNVILECMKLYNEDFVFMVDNLNCPYGDKPPNEVLNITQNNIAFLTKRYKPDVIILACNTASSVIDFSNLDYSVPILKTSPDLSCAENTHEKTLLFATKNTIKYNKNVRYYLANYPNIKTANIKNLAKNIDFFIKNREKSDIFSKLSNKFIQYGRIKKAYIDVKNISLGCTHFKHVELYIKKIFNNVKFLECEKRVALDSKFLIRKEKQSSSVKILLTKDDSKFKTALENLFCENCLVN